MAATDSIPLNFGFTGKGNDAGLNGPRGIVEAGAMGLKLHEDWGSTPEAIDRALIIGDEYDIQVSLDRYDIGLTLGQYPHGYA